MQLSDADRLKFVRKFLSGISQKKLSDIIDIPLYKIRDIESGKIKMSVEIASIIEEKFNFNFKWLLTGNGDPIYDSENLEAGSAIKKGFNSDEQAIEVNQDLVAIKRMNPQKFRELCAYIKGARSMLAYDGPERRKKDEPDKIPNGEERRKTGTEG